MTFGSARGQVWASQSCLTVFGPGAAGTVGDGVDRDVSRCTEQPATDMAAATTTIRISCRYLRVLLPVIGASQRDLRGYRSQDRQALISLRFGMHCGAAASTLLEPT